MTMQNLTALPYVAWVEPQDEHRIVLSTRLRLARNLSSRNFPHRLNDAEAEEICGKLAAALPQDGEFAGVDWQILRLDELLEREQGVLLEKHLLSRDILQHTQGRALAVNAAQTLALMFNEEDHLRMQAILPGLQPEAAWQRLSALDDRLSERLDFAFDDKLGFLTACPTNLGTGLRASVMLHLPALQITGRLEGIFAQLPQAGMTVRGVYGEGSQSEGNLFQISNRLTLGLTEEEIISRLRRLTEQLVAQEVQAEEWLRANRLLWLQDKIGRACGILSSAYLLSSAEAMQQISLVRLGLAMGLCDKIDWRELNLLMLAVQTPFLLTDSRENLSAAERDAARAKLCRQKMCGSAQADIL